MNHLNPGLISAYNSLTDKHLAGYFSNTRIRRHLQRAGLITRSGRIVPDKEYRHRLIQRAHQRHVRECLAQAIFHKVLEMERLHQIEIKRKLEEFARRERVHKIKVERSKRYEDDIIRILSPRPPTGARGFRKQNSGPEGEHSESSESPSSSRPNTAPGKMQRPVRLKPIHSSSTTATVRRSSPYRRLESSRGNGPPFNCTNDKESRRRLTPMEASHGISPYCLPVINNFVTPVPPATKRKDRGVKVSRSSTIRGRRLRPTTASSGADVNEEPPMLRSSVHQSKVTVNMVYFGKTVHLSLDLTDMRDDIKVFQQHCGGENLCVFKGKLREGEMFQFISRRHRGFPFSLTFFLNGLQVERLSSCCEFKHRKGPRLGGRHGHFGFCGVEGASPCYKCIIAMGLDKKPTPPPRRVKENTGREESVSSLKDSAEVETERMGDDALSHSDCEPSQPRDMETEVEEKMAGGVEKVRDEYEEDFEADDEGPAENEVAGEKKSPPLPRDNERQLKEKDVSDTEDDDKDEDMKSHSGSSGSDQEASDDEVAIDPREDEKAEQAEEVNHEESVSVSNENDEHNHREAAATKDESAKVKDSNMQTSAGDSTKIEISDSGGLSGKEKIQSDDVSGVNAEAETTVEESKQEEEQERAKSVQEKLAEAILKESQCNSEPELSDTSTEESVDEAPKKDNKDAITEKLHTSAEHQQTIVVETRSEESVSGDAEAAQKQEEETESKEENEGEKKPIENIDITEDEKADEVVENEKAAGDEDESEIVANTNDAPQHGNETTAPDQTTADSLEQALTKSMDVEAAAKDDAKEEGVAEESYNQHDEKEQGPKSEEEDESSASEANKTSDETAAPDNAEAEAMTAGETMERKAESSEKPEALSCEEAPVTDAGEAQQPESEDRTAAASGTEVTAETLSSSAEESRDATAAETADSSVENTNGAIEENAKGEESKDEVKDASETAVNTEDSRGQSEVGEEKTAMPGEIDEKLEEQKSEEHHNNQEMQCNINFDEIVENENTAEGENYGKEKTQEVESNADEMIGKEENPTEETGSVAMADTKEAEEAEETTDEHDLILKEEVEKNEEGLETDCDETKGENKEFGVKGVDENNEDEDKSAAVDVKDDAEKFDREDKETKPEEEVSGNKNTESCEDKTDSTDTPAVETLELTKDTDEENVKNSQENIRSEDVGEGDSAETTKSNEKTSDDKNGDEDVIKEEKASNGNENRGSDVEQDEISDGAESNTLLLEGEAPLTDTHDLKAAAQQDEEEIKTDEPTEGQTVNTNKSPATSGESTEKHSEYEGDRPAAGDAVEMVRSDNNEEDAEKHDKSTKDISTPGTSYPGTKSKLDYKKGSEVNAQDEDSCENDESDLTEKNNNISEVTTVSSRAQEQSSAPTSVHFDNISGLHDKEESPDKGDSLREKLAGEHVVSVDVSAAEGENGVDTEEASKASEEGASVLLKPDVQNNEAEDPGQDVTVLKGPPEALAVADNTDLVTNWINMHQSSKYFETFVEPLEDLRKISDDQMSNSNKEETPPVVHFKATASELKDGNETRDRTKVEAVESDLDHIQAEDKPCDSYSANLTQQVEESTEVNDLLPKSEIEQNKRESANTQDTTPEAHNVSRASLEEDKVNDGPTKKDSEIYAFSKTEVESITAPLESTDSHKAGSVSEKQPHEKTTDNGPDFNLGQTATKEMKDPSEEDCLDPESPDRLKDADERWERTDVQSQEMREISDLTASKSNDRSQEESPGGESEAKVSDESNSKDRNELIQDIKHTLSKDRLSTFFVDESMFGCSSSYSLLTTTRTESGH